MEKREDSERISSEQEIQRKGMESSIGNEENIIEQLEEDELDKMIAKKVRFEPQVENFFRSLYEDIYERNIENIKRLYEIEYNQITEKYFPDCRWPEIEEVEAFYRQFGLYHSLILTLYKDLYYRHLFDKCSHSVTWKDRKDSWENYSRFLGYLLDEECNHNVEGLKLPSQWIWDILDEFVYQFQEACRWRMTIGKKLPIDEKERKKFLNEMQQDADVWKSSQVLEHLHLFVEKSNIRAHIKEKREESMRVAIVELEFHHQVGYFSMINLLRLHVLMGDYQMAVQVVSDIEISPRAYYWKLPACHVSFFYNLGFAYMMMRRFNDAIRNMSLLLIFVTKQRGYLASQGHQQSSMNRIVERMYLCVMLCSSLSSMRLDESVLQFIKEKHTDKFYKLQQESEETYRDLFAKCSPKFINPMTPSYEKCEELENLAQNSTEIHNRQLNIFLREINFQKKISNINSFAKFYNNIQLSKLASLMQIQDKDPEDALRSEFLCVKHKSRQRVWRSGNLLNGEFTQMNIDGQMVEFSIIHDTLNVKTQKQQKVYIDYFLKQIERSQALYTSLQTNSPYMSNQRSNQRNQNQNENYNRNYNSNQNQDNSNYSYQRYNQNRGGDRDREDRGGDRDRGNRGGGDREREDRGGERGNRGWDRERDQNNSFFNKQPKQTAY